MNKIAIAAAIFVFGIASGWLVHGWKYDAEQLAIRTAQEIAFNKALKGVNSISEGLQDTLDRLEKNKFVTAKEVFHETTKTEYRCVLPESGRLLYNRAAASSATSEP